MQAKKIVAKDMRTALSTVRDVMGPQAIILSNKKVAAGIELLCTLDQSAIKISTGGEGKGLSGAKPSDALPEINAGSDGVRAGGNNKRDGSRQIVNAVSPAAEKKNSKQKEQKNTPAEPVGTKNDNSYLARELDRVQQQSRQQAQQMRQKLRQKSKTECKQSVVTIEDIQYPAAVEQTVQVEKTVKDDSRVVHGWQAKTSVNDEEGDNTGELVQQHNSSSPAQNAEHAASRESLAALLQELSSMRQMLQYQLNGTAWKTFNERNPVQATLWRRLKKMDLRAGLIQKLLTIVTPQTTLDQGWHAVLKQFAECMGGTIGKDILQGGIHAFVGPAAIGKTTTIGKLASQYVMANGSEGLALISLDTRRIGAQEQLRVYGRILNVPVKSIDNPLRLMVTLHELRSKDLILIDTAGLGAQDLMLNDQKQALADLKSKVDTHIVLSASAQAQVNENAYETYRSVELQSCVISQLDETTSLGGLLSLICEKGLALSYVTDGQQVPNDLHIAKASSLVNQAVKLAQCVELDELMLADEFSSSWTVPLPEKAALAVNGC